MHLTFAGYTWTDAVCACSVFMPVSLVLVQSPSVDGHPAGVQTLYSGNGAYFPIITFEACRAFTLPFWYKLYIM